MTEARSRASTDLRGWQSPFTRAEAITYAIVRLQIAFHSNVTFTENGRRTKSMKRLS